MENKNSTAWYKDRESPPPFTLTRKFNLNIPNPPSFQCVAFFPWTSESLSDLWDGSLDTPELVPQWKVMVKEWTGAIAVGGGDRLFVLSALRPGRPMTLRLPAEKKAADVRAVAWALSQDTPLEPLVVFSGSSVLRILNVKQEKVITTLRGHGGPVTAIAVHPRYPYLLCTTSRDFSTRIYDLTMTPQQKPNNPHWPPSTVPSLGGGAHGLHMSEPEGVGVGRCVAVLMGGRSGGHQAEVLGACKAFHSHLPLIATCGMDRCVKIWHLPPLTGQSLANEDKPLFSSTLLHKARVLSITWLSHDVLVTHCAPALMGLSDRNRGIEFEHGTVVVWRWLGLDRFFPPNQPSQKILRGCASDYQESASFKIVSIYALPIIETEHEHVPISPSLYAHRAPGHDPLLLFTFPHELRITSLGNLKPRQYPPFPHDQTMEGMTKRMRLVDDDGQALPEIDGWELGLSSDGDEKFQACAMGLGGSVIVGITSNGGLCIWNLTSSS